MFKRLCATAVQQVKLNKTSVSLEVGKTFQLKATISPSNASNKKVTYTSSNKNAATVSSSSLITAKGTGSYTITATSNNNKKAIVKVSVTLPKVSSVKLNQSSINMLGDKVTLRPAATPRDAARR